METGRDEQIILSKHLALKQDPLHAYLSKINMHYLDYIMPQAERKTNRCIMPKVIAGKE